LSISAEDALGAIAGLGGHIKTTARPVGKPLALVVAWVAVQVSTLGLPDRAQLGQADPVIAKISATA
jgi:hypothetical protein